MPAVRGWRAKFKRGDSLLPQIKINKDAAERGLRIFSRLKVPDMPGTPRLGEVAGDWYKQFVYAFFGAVDRTGRRTISEAFICVPKKNAKTSYTAGLMLTATIMNRRPSADFVIIAPTKIIADIAFQQIAGAVRLDAELKKIFNVRDNLKTIERRLDHTKLKVMAADTNIVTGGKQVGTYLDETHEMPKKSDASAVLAQLRGALSARPDGFLIQTTTLSHREPVGAFAAELKTARDVRDGKTSLPLLPLIYEWPRDWLKSERYREPALWSLVNPNLGKSVSFDFLRREYERVSNTDKETEQIFLAQHLNVQVQTRLTADGWVGAHYWAAAADKKLTLDSLLRRCEAVVVGIDGGGFDDLLALSVLGRERGAEDRWLLWSHAFCKPILLRRFPQIADTLLAAKHAGELTISRKNKSSDDIDKIVAIVEKIMQRGLLPMKSAVGLDPMGVSSICDALQRAGVREGRYVAVQQGWRLAFAIQGAERKLADGSLLHHDSALLNWCVGNAVCGLSGNAKRILKADSRPHEKIDLLISSLNCVALMTAHPRVGSVYNERPVARAIHL